MIVSGYDSAFGPSLAVAQQARAQGSTFWFGYLGGQGAYHVWTGAEWLILYQAGLIPGCLWVPSMALMEDPHQSGLMAVAIAESRGLYGAIMLDTEEQMKGPRLALWVDIFYATVRGAGRPCPIYDGAGYVPAGAPSFAPDWGSSTYPTSGQAKQYGPAVRFGMSVDVDLADSAFPLASFTKPTPPAPPTPPVHLEEDMLLIAETAQGSTLVQGGHRILIQDTADFDNLIAGAKAANVPVVVWKMSDRQLQAIPVAT